MTKKTALERHKGDRQRNSVAPTGKINDVTAFVDFLISDGVSYITGQMIVVDGGDTA